jgi:hypothetical protein
MEALTTDAVLERIAAHPNPRAGRVRLTWLRWKSRYKASVAWGKSLNRDAAYDSGRNVLAVIGGATVLADFTTMRLWMLAPSLAFAFFLWYMDYLRHF